MTVDVNNPAVTGMDFTGMLAKMLAHDAAILALQNSVGLKDQVVYKGDLKLNAMTCITSAVVDAFGKATFYLTDNNAANGNAIFQAVFLESARPWTKSGNIKFDYSNYVLSADLKTLTVDVKKPTEVTVAIVGLVAGVGFSNVGAGEVINLTIRGI